MENTTKSTPLQCAGEGVVSGKIMINEYRECVRVCGEIDYADKSSVKRSNKAVYKMYQLVQAANDKGTEAVAELASLLNEPECAKWLAHQLVEKAAITKEIKNKCFAVVETLAKGESAEALGDRIWLKENRDHENR